MTKQTKRTASSPRAESPNALYGAVAMTAMLMAIGSALPAKRLWGLGVWADFGIPAVVVAALVMATIAGAVVRFAAGREPGRGSQTPDSKAFALFAVATLVMTLLFAVGHARTHFLGDGYTLLSLLAADNPLIKTRSYGSGMLTVMAKKALGGEGDSGALLAYQVVSVLCGLAFAAVTAWSAFKLFKDAARRWLWFGGLVTGGYALMFFGYAENYASFVTAVLACLAAGLIAIKQGRIPWLAIPLCGLAIFLHVLGTVLLPAVAYGVVSQTPMGKRIEQWPVKLKVAGLVVMGVLGTAAFAYAFTHDYYFRFSLLPLVSTMFVPDGYTLLSARHLVDFINLLVILVPSVGILTLATKPSWRQMATSYEGRFLGLGLLGSLGAVFVFDPKLGMPRDWDLFSFVGVPLLAFLLFAVLQRQHRLTMAAVGAALVVQLGFLIPRVAALVVEDAGVRQFERYSALDIKRNRTGLYLLEKHYVRKRDFTAKQRIDSIRIATFYEERQATMVSYLLGKGQLDETKVILDSMFKRNSAYSEYWLGLGRYLLGKRQPDTALTALRIADGLNPYSWIVQNEIGLVYFATKDYATAEKYFRAASEIDTNLAVPLYNLALVYQSRGDSGGYATYLAQAASRSKAEASDMLELADLMVAQKRMAEAAQWYQKALANGADPSLIRQRVTANPDLQQWLK